jgi:23S rRNA (adenine2503-C2)-methyltransferase
MTPAPRYLFDELDGGLERWLDEAGEPKYRAKQIVAWAAQRRAESFEQMSDLSKTLRAKLDAEWKIFSTTPTRVSRDPYAGAEKALLQLSDGRAIECVLLLEDDRRTVCMSTQVGCAMGCVFCASGLDGVERNLRVGEMIEQLVRLRNRLPVEERLSHIVVMGMGEPLLNVDSLIRTLDFATSPNGLGMSARHVTISTVGLPPKIRKLADLKRQYHLAVSLHAPNDELRRQIVPTARRVALADLLEAAEYYREVTGRQVTFEYVLLGGINDRPEHAVELGKLLRRQGAFVNLIPFNPVPGLPYRTPAPEDSKKFAEILVGRGIPVKIRKKKGSAVNAACGQLRRSVVVAPQLVELETAARIDA